MARPKKISDEDLLEIARECFFEKGPQISTREIAERAGLSQPALFKRFKTKEDLFLAALASKAIFSKVIDLIAWITTHPQKGPFQPQLEELLTRLSNLLVEILPRLIAMHSQRSTLSPEKLFSLMKKPPPVKILEAIANFIARAQRNGQVPAELDSATLAMNLLGSIQGRIFFTRILSYTDTQADNDYIKETVRNFCQGLSIEEYSK